MPSVTWVRTTREAADAQRRVERGRCGRKQEWERAVRVRRERSVVTAYRCRSPAVVSSGTRKKRRAVGERTSTR